MATLVQSAANVSSACQHEMNYPMKLTTEMMHNDGLEFPKTPRPERIRANKGASMLVRAPSNYDPLLAASFSV